MTDLRGRNEAHWRARKGAGYVPPSEGRDLAMVEMRASGAGLKEIAARFGVSIERVRQILKDRAQRAAPRVP